jgi:NitT/TauT family transport system substrate-binding protein
MKIAIPDMVSNSYFPAIAAVELGHFKEAGLDIDIAPLFPVNKAYEALRDGAVDFVAGSAHSALAAFPQWEGVKLLCAQGQGMYWFLVMRADLARGRGNLDVVKGRRIGAAPWVDMGLRRLLAAGGIDVVKDGVQIAPVAAASSSGVSFGVAAAKALDSGLIDGFWANGMGTEVAVRSGVGEIVLDIRRGDGPSGCFNYTMAAVAATDRLIGQRPDLALAITKAISKTHAALKRDPELATDIGRKLFRAHEAGLIAELVRRDLPYYDTSISRESVTGMNQFAQDMGILAGDVAYENIVAR